MTRVLPFALALAATLPLAAQAEVSQAGVSVTPIADAARGTMVTVQGTVEQITDEDEFRLTDASGSILIYVGPNPVPAALGEAVTVSGFVDDDRLGPLEIYARQLIKADETVVTFNHSYD